MASDDDTPFDFGRHAGDLLRELQPELVALFEEHRLTPAEADEVVDASLVALGLGGGRTPVARARARFLATVRERCRRVVEERLNRVEGPEN